MPAAGSGLPENLAGALAYVLGPITGILFFILDRQRPFVRFHAVQCLAVCVSMVALSVALMILSTVLAFIPIVGWLVGLLLSLGLSLGGFALWIWLMLKAYQGKEWALPGLAPHVRRLADETGGSAGASATGD
jgi:uncharacterized membrane protein